MKSLEFPRRSCGPSRIHSLWRRRCIRKEAPAVDIVKVKVLNIFNHMIDSCKNVQRFSAGLSIVTGVLNLALAMVMW